MVDLAPALSLISGFYDAATSGRGWPQALQHTAGLLGARAALIHWQSGPADAGSLWSEELDPIAASQLVQQYLRLEALGVHEQTLPVGSVFAASDVLQPRAAPSAAAPARTRWLEGCTDLITTVLERSDERCVRLILVMGDPQKNWGANQRTALEFLLPHLQRALKVGHTLEQSECRAVAFGEALERIATAAIVVDGNGRVVRANRAGVQHLAHGRVVHCEVGRVRLRDAAADSQLRALLLEPQHVSTLEVASVHLVKLEGGERLMLNLVPLSQASRRDVLGRSSAAVVIVITDPSADLTQRVHSAARYYAFTPAEARVVQALLGGCTIGSIARRLGIAEATVKTHLQHVFDKTDTRRQVDLVKRIADHAPMPAPQRPGLGDVMLASSVLS